MDCGGGNKVELLFVKKTVFLLQELQEDGLLFCRPAFLCRRPAEVFCLPR
jgi:hypothetical protein